MSAVKEVLRKTHDGKAVRETGENFETRKITDFSSHKVPLVMMIETITGKVGIEIQIGQICDDVANQALRNKSGKAVALSGLISAQVVQKKIDVTREPSRWAEEEGHE